MPATIQSIVDSAEKEWKYWGKPTWVVPTGETYKGHVDNETDFAKYVIDSYCAVGGGSPSLLDIQDDRYYWSAVGLSAIMKQAGFTKTEFPFAQSHSVFVRHFIAARQTGKLSPFYGYRIDEQGSQPDIGDIVVYGRGKNMTHEKARSLFDRTSRYDSHADIVVAKHGSEIEVIGANVLDSVTRKTLAIDNNGYIKDDHHPWFAVLKFHTI